MLKAPIYEIFSSWQGEGLFVGSKQVFVRFSGCNLACIYCDEKAALLKAARMTAEETAEKIKKLAENSLSRFVSFTGGEPLLYSGFIKKLIGLLGRKDFRFFLETNGTLPKKLSRIAGLVDIVSMDLKMPSSSGKITWNDHRKFLDIAGSKAYVKVVVSPNTTPMEFEKGVKLVAAAGHDIPFYIQPENSWFASSRDGKDVFAVCDKFYRIAALRLRNVSVLPQLHRLWGVR